MNHQFLLLTEKIYPVLTWCVYDKINIGTSYFDNAEEANFTKRDVPQTL